LREIQVRKHHQFSSMNAYKIYPLSLHFVIQTNYCNSNKLHFKVKFCSYVSKTDKLLKYKRDKLM